MKLPRTPLIAIVTIVGLLAALALFIIPRLESRDTACEVREFETSRFIVCSFDPRRQDMRLYSRASEGGYLRGFEALQQELGGDARRVRFAMNAGMYNDAGAPIGLYVQDGDEQKSISLTDGPGNFHLKSNGVFWQSEDGALHIDVSDRWRAASAHRRGWRIALHPQRRWPRRPEHRLFRDQLRLCFVRPLRTFLPRRTELPRRAFPRRHGVEPLGAFSRALRRQP